MYGILFVGVVGRVGTKAKRKEGGEREKEGERREGGREGRKGQREEKERQKTEPQPTSSIGSSSETLKLTQALFLP